MAKMMMLEAINKTLEQEMNRDERVVVMGEDVGIFGGCFGVTAGLLDKFGEERIIDFPIAENTLIGANVGMALGGMKVVSELMFADFAEMTYDEILNKMGKWKWMHGGWPEFNTPVVLRLPTGMVGGSGPEHSQSNQNLFMGAQGLYVVVPSNAGDAVGLLRTAIRGEDPVLFFEHKMLYGMEAEVPDDPDYCIPFGQANVCREGKDVTVVATALQVTTAMQAAEQLAAEGIDCEVIDPRTLVPFDKETLFASVRKTGKLVVCHEDPKTGGTGEFIAAMIVEEDPSMLTKPIEIVSCPDVPNPHSVYLETTFCIPTVERLVAGIKKVCE